MTIYRCPFCTDSGLVFAKCKATSNVYVFRHACSVGLEKREAIPLWRSGFMEKYVPESNV